MAVLAIALGAAASVLAQGDDVSPANREVGQLLNAAQQQMAAGDFKAAGATLDRIPTLGSLSQQEVSIMLYLRGQVFYELGQPGQAVSAWNQALRIGGLPQKLGTRSFSTYRSCAARRKATCSTSATSI